MMSVLILGGGYAGLGAALKLGKAGVETILMESAPALGGLGSCTSIGGILLERFYHHMKPEDVDILALIDQFGMGDHVNWVDTRMGFLTGGQIYQFSTPFDLLRFKPFGFFDKLRFAQGVFKAKRTDGRSLTNLDAESWILKEWGGNVYERMMKGMLLNKFGLDPSEISAAFLHGRIKGLSSSKSSFKGGERLAYLRGSTQRLTDEFQSTVREKTEVHTDAALVRLDRKQDGFIAETKSKKFHANFVINTLPLTVFEAIQKNFEFHHTIRYQAAVCGIFVIQEPVSTPYWLNILDPGISFRVLVNQTVLDDYPNTVLYCGNYLQLSADFLRLADQEIASRYLQDLESILGKISVVDYGIFRTRWATPVFDKDFASRVADLDLRVKGMIFAGNIKIYPGSRTLSSVLRTGYAAADQVLRHQ
jgi:protoporphyrinogen oxidase